MSDLDWEGCWNVRELGGLSTNMGSTTRRGVIVRASSLHTMTQAGWAAAVSDGVTTVVDLRNTEEAQAHHTAAPRDVQVVRTPLEDGLNADPEFAEWARNGLLGTPLYYRPYLDRWGERCVPVFEAIAQSRGAAIVHCRAGTDRTGMICAMLLQIAGVPADVIIHDYLRSYENMASPKAHALGIEEDRALEFERRGLTPRVAFEEFLENLDAESELTAHGLSKDMLRSLRDRLAGGPRQTSL